MARCARTFAAIGVPVLAIGGWADAYTNAVPRLLAHLEVPRLGIIGPWAHIYPHDGVPAPAIGFLQEATRWWDTWLKGRDTGIMREPMLRAFIEDYAEPSTSRATSRGRFVAEQAWPSPEINEQALHLWPGLLAPQPPAERERLAIRSPLWTGASCGEWMGTGIAGEMPADQRQDDGLSLVFDTPPLTEDVEILGFPRLELDIAADRPNAQIGVRLNDVAPDGASLRVSYAVLNLAHRDGSAAPQPMPPGETIRISLPLKVCGHRFPAGHRIRLAISSAYWPLVWPARDRATITLTTGASLLLLPVRKRSSGEFAPSFAAPEQGRKAAQTLLRAGRMERQASIS